MLFEILPTVTLLAISIICLCFYEVIKYKRLLIIGTVAFLCGLVLFITYNKAGCSVIMDEQFPSRSSK